MANGLLKILILVLLFGFLTCTNKSVTPKTTKLELVNSVPLKIQEPSGLTFNRDKTKLWVVGDKESKIYLMDLDGNIEKQYDVSLNDLEGITSIDDSIIVVVSERNREILFLSLNDSSESILQTGLTGEENHGLEGITYYLFENTFCIANEKNPKSIFKINSNGKILNYNLISFSKDVSGLYFDNIENVLWILSEESNMIYMCALDFQILETYPIENNKFEGIAVNGKNIYLVSDSNNILNIYQILE